jgi:ryanodine receptor 2
MATASVPPSIADLNQDYLRRIRRYDLGAVRWKGRYQLAWLASTVLTLATLALTITALEFPGQQRFDDLCLHVLIPLFGYTVTALTVLQTVFGLQHRWLGYRAAVQGLWKTCMLYRVGLPPFGGRTPDEEVLARKMEEIGRDVETRKRQTFRQWLGQLAEDFRLPACTRVACPHLPEEGLLPRLADENAVLGGRLLHQKQWYLARARRYRLWYLLFQGGIALISLFNALYVTFAGRAFGLVAGTTTFNLGLIACRDFLECGPLWLQYRQAAGDLQDIEDSFVHHQPPFDTADRVRLLKRLVEQIEQTLSTEFTYWYAIRLRWKPAAAVPTDGKADGAPAAGYRPQPIPTAGVELTPEVLHLTELLARNAHDHWAAQRLADGWVYGPRRDDGRKEHPCLVSYDDLPESEKEYDRAAALETLRAVLALGYRIDRTPRAEKPS